MYKYLRKEWEEKGKNSFDAGDQQGHTNHKMFL